MALSCHHIDAGKTENISHWGPRLCSGTLVMSVPGTGCTEEKRCNVFTHTHTRKERQSRCTFFSPFIFLWIFPYHLSDRLWDTEKPCWKPHHRGLAQTETHTPHICSPSKWNSNADTRSTGWRHYVLLPPPLTVCPWSCSIFPHKYHPGQSIKDISLFLKHRMTLSLPLSHCYVMLRPSLSPISQSILFKSLHSLHATFASPAPFAHLSRQAPRHWAILLVFVELWHHLLPCMLYNIVLDGWEN